MHIDKDSSQLEAWRTLQRRQTYQVGDGKYLKVELHMVELPGGEVLEDWPWVITPDYVNIVAETEDKRFICFRQTKYAAKGVTLSVTGGYMEPGEDPLETGQRELLEETGYTAHEWIHLGTSAVDGNRGSGTAHLYLARGAKWHQPIDADDLEEQHMLLLTRDEMQSALLHAEFKVLSWATAVAIALVWLRANDEK